MSDWLRKISDYLDTPRYDNFKRKIKQTVPISFTDDRGTVWAIKENILRSVEGVKAVAVEVDRSNPKVERTVVTVYIRQYKPMRDKDHKELRHVLEYTLPIEIQHTVVYDEPPNPERDNLDWLTMDEYINMIEEIRRNRRLF